MRNGAVNSQCQNSVPEGYDTIVHCLVPKTSSPLGGKEVLARPPGSARAKILCHNPHPKMKFSFKNSKAFHKACLMPAGLNHWPNRNDQPFNFAKSEVIAWVINQPEIQGYLFDKLHQSKAILFDPESQTWYGSASQ